MTIRHDWHDSWNYKVTMKVQLKSKAMKIAVTSRGKDPQSAVYEQFGRAYWLLIYSPEVKVWVAIENGINRARTSNAGVATAEFLQGMGVTAVLTGETGPKAFRTLNQAGIDVFHNVSGIVEEALIDWQEGRLAPASLANDVGSPNCLLKMSPE